MIWLKKNGFLIVRWAIAIACFVYLGIKLTSAGKEDISFQVLFSEKSNFFLLFLVFALMFVNWAIEAIKWKSGAGLIEKLSFKNSFSSVLAGLAVSMVGPNRTGEFLGRITALSPGNRIAGSFISVHISLAQTIITLITGFFSIALIDPDALPFKAGNISIILVSTFISLLLIFIYFRFALVYRMILKTGLSKWIGNLSMSNVKLSTQFLTANLLLSALRYSVFALQFVILMNVSGSVLSIYDSFIAAVLIYFIMSAIPSFALADLGIRGTVSVYVAGIFAVNSGPFILASSLLWLINVAIPAAAGAVILAAKRSVSVK